MTSAKLSGRYRRYSAGDTQAPYPRRASDFPAPRECPARDEELPAHPAEPAYPCCLPALGGFSGIPPRGESGGHSTGPGPHGRTTPDASEETLDSPTEDSPSGLGRTIGNRVGLNTLAGSNPASSAL